MERKPSWPGWQHQQQPGCGQTGYANAPNTRASCTDLKTQPQAQVGTCTGFYMHNSLPVTIPVYLQIRFKYKSCSIPVMKPSCTPSGGTAAASGAATRSLRPTSVAILWVDHHVALHEDFLVDVDGWANDGVRTSHQLATCTGEKCPTSWAWTTMDKCRVSAIVTSGHKTCNTIP